MAEIEELLKKKNKDIEDTLKTVKDIDDIQKKENLLNKLAKLLEQKNSLLNSLLCYKNVIEEDNLDNENCINKEAYIEGHNLSMNLNQMNLYSKQMEKTICKINKSETVKGTGFICKINKDGEESKEGKSYQVLITCHHVLDQDDLKVGKKINLSFKKKGYENKTLKINNLRLIYTNKDYDITIIELKKGDNFDENDMLTIDENIYLKNYNSYYPKNYIYMIHYPKGDIVKFSSDKIVAIKGNLIIHTCSTEDGSSGAPIINLENSKVIGVHFGSNEEKNNKEKNNGKNNVEKNKGKKEKKSNVYNVGRILKEPLNEFFKLKLEKKNFIILKLEVDKSEINKDIYFLDNDLYTDDIIREKTSENSFNKSNELNKSNIKIYINEELLEYSKCFKPKKEGVYKIKIELDGKIKNCSQMFHGCSNITFIDLSNFDSEMVTNMNYMFSGCKKLKKIDLSSFSGDKVTSMSYTFYLCWELEDIDLSSFNSENVKDMSGLFCHCPMKNLDLSNLNTKNLVNMTHMFYGCKNLDNLNLENFNTKNVSNMSGLFAGCTNLNNLDLSSFDTKNVTNMACMFFDCRNLKTINLSKFNTENVGNMFSMFLNCFNLSELNLSSFNTKNVTDMMQMFGECKKLVNLDLSNFDTSNAIAMMDMFRGCESLINLNIMNFNCHNNNSFFPNDPFSSSPIKFMFNGRMFRGCKNLINVVVSYRDFNNKAFMDDLTNESKRLNNIRVWRKDGENILYNHI